MLCVQSELVHLFSLLTSGELWNVAPFNTAAAEMQVLKDVSISGMENPLLARSCSRYKSGIGEQLETYGLHDVAHSIYLPMRRFSTSHRFKVRWMLSDKRVVVYGRSWMLVRSLGSNVLMAPNFPWIR